MNETYVTIVGNVASGVTRRRTLDGTDVASFRMASNVRRFDREAGTWQTTATSFYTVTAWRQLACNVGATVVKGDPVVVHGRLLTRGYVTRDGVERTDVEIDATALGPDLSRCTAALSRTPRRPEPEEGETTGAQVGVETTPGEETDSETGADTWPERTELSATG